MNPPNMLPEVVPDPDISGFNEGGVIEPPEPGEVCEAEPPPPASMKGGLLNPPNMALSAVHPVVAALQ